MEKEWPKLNLTPKEVHSINECRNLEKELLDFMWRLENIDRRWGNIAKTHFEQGFMALVRAIANPLEED